MTRSHRNEDRGGDQRRQTSVTARRCCRVWRQSCALLLGGDSAEAPQWASRNAPSRRGATAGRAPREGTKPAGGLVSFHHGRPKTLPSARTQARRSASNRGSSPSQAIRSAPSPACWAAMPRHPVSREVERSGNPEVEAVAGATAPSRGRGPWLKRPKPRKAARSTRDLWDEIAAGLRRHWAGQIANQLKSGLPG